jgi:hypothetical protein
MVRWLLRGLRRAGFDYACFRIFAFSLDTTRNAPDPSIEGYRFTELSRPISKRARTPS